MKIYVVSKQGVEWNEIQSAHSTMAKAKKAAERLEKDKGAGVIERISSFKITDLVLDAGDKP